MEATAVLNAPRASRASLPPLPEKVAQNAQSSAYDCDEQGEIQRQVGGIEWAKEERRAFVARRGEHTGLEQHKDAPSEVLTDAGDIRIPVAAAIGGPELADRAAALLLAAESPNTLRSSRAGWTSFVRFYTTYEHHSLPSTPATIIAYGTCLVERPAFEAVVGKSQPRRCP